MIDNKLRINDIYPTYKYTDREVRCTIGGRGIGKSRELKQRYLEKIFRYLDSQIKANKRVLEMTEYEYNFVCEQLSYMTAKPTTYKGRKIKITKGVNILND